MKKAIDPSKWEWFGANGHFCGGRHCRFHLATKVGKYLISTVGEYAPPFMCGTTDDAEATWWKKNWPGMDLGYGRKYETMVFLAGVRCSDKICGCKMPEISGDDLDFAGYNLRGDAIAGHMRMCKKYAKK